MLNCSFCNRECKSKVSQVQHTIRCKLNPNKIIVKPTFGMLGKTGGNQFTKNPNHKISEETREKLSKHLAERRTINWASDEFKVKHKASMKQAVLDHPEAYSSSNRGRAKHSIYNGVEMQSSWEEVFAIWLDANTIPWVKCQDSFPYSWNGDRRYFPDFYLIDLDVYVEVKGYRTERDDAKWEQFPHTLLIIKQDQIKEIQKGSFDKTKLLDFSFTK